MRIQLLAALLAALLGTAVAAQRPTLRERIAQEKTNVALTISSDGPIMVFERVLQETDRVVRAKIGPAVVHLSDDGRDIYTTFELTSPQVFFSSTSIPNSTAPGKVPPPLTLAQPGGTLSIDGFTATVKYDDTPRLMPGMDAVILLHDNNGTNWIAGNYAVFEVRGAAVAPLDHRPGEHQGFTGMNIERFVAEIVARRERLPAR
jgi:hypothetical protein